MTSGEAPPPARSGAAEHRAGREVDGEDRSRARRLMPEESAPRGARYHRRVNDRNQVRSQPGCGVRLRPDLVLAQDVVQRRLQVGLLAPPADDERAPELIRPGGELLRPRAGDDDRVGRHVAAMLDRLRAR